MNRHDLNMAIAQELKVINDDAGALVAGILSDDISWEDQITYAEFLSSVSDPTCYTAISMKPLDGVAAFEMSPAIVFPMIDRLLGGTGESVRERGRHFETVPFAEFGGLECRFDRESCDA